MWFFLQAGIVASLDSLVKEFIAASNDEEKKNVYSKMEEEVGKLSGSPAKYTILYLILAFSFLRTVTYSNSISVRLFVACHISSYEKKIYISRN